MSENLPIRVDRREETVVTQKPGYSVTEQVVRDVAAERRLRLFQVNRIIWSILGLLEILLGFRFGLKLLGANPDSGFGTFIYGITAPFVAAFATLLPTPVSEGMVLEITTLVAMLVYALIFWGIVYAIQLISDRPSASLVTRSTREQTPDGSQRTTRTSSTR